MSVNNEHLRDSTIVDDQLSSRSVISKDAIQDKIYADAVDSTYIDHLNEKMYLYGNAVVKFQTMVLEAGVIIIDYKKNEAEAFPQIDSLGNEIGKPNFKDGDNQFICSRLRYNFDSKKGMVYSAVSQEGDLFLHGSKTKFISKEADTLMQDDVIYSKNAIVTSCDADHPHFGVMAKKIKIVPGKVAIVGPSWLRIMDIPLIPLPFGFFPMAKNKSTGLIFPTYLNETTTRGVGLQNLGWYFPISDKLDLKLTGDIFSRGDWALRANSNYKVKYKYNGSINLQYARKFKEDDLGFRSSTPSYSIEIVHRQDTKAHPYRKINGRIKISTNGHFKGNFRDSKTQRTNTYFSNFGLAYALPTSPFRFNLDFKHEQNTNNKKVTVEFPVAKVSMKNIFPFKSKLGGNNKEKWYEKISMSYNGFFKNKIEATDSTLFEKETFDNMKNGLRQEFDTGISFKLFNYFNFKINAYVNENWALKSTNKYLNNEYVVDTTHFYNFDSSVMLSTVYDTTSYGVVKEEIVDGFKAQHDYGVSASLNTKFFGTYQRKNGFFRGIRHVITPSISLVYRPDSRSVYGSSYYSDLRKEVRKTVNYSRFQNAVYKDGLDDGGLSINYGFTNTFEAKYYSKKDTITKKFKLFNNISLNGRYKLEADSLNWSQIGVRASTPLFWGWSTLTIDGALDPYLERNGTRINTFVWEDGFKLPEIDRLKISLMTRFKIKKIIDLISGKSKTSKEESKKEKFKSASSRLMDMFEKLEFNHNFIYQYNRIDDRDTSFVNIHSITIRGTIAVSENWSLNIGNIGYDFINKKINYPDLGFSRKLHCWNMSFQWTPNSESYGFLIGVSSTSLGFLKTRYGDNQGYVPY